MSRWIQACFFCLLCAVSASPLLAQQIQKNARFPRTLRDAIDPGAASSLGRSERGVQSPGYSKPSARSPSAGRTYQRKTPAMAISSNRLLGRRLEGSHVGSNAGFEFGTVMMFPASDERSRPRGVSGVYRPPGSAASGNDGSELDQTPKIQLSSAPADSSLTASVNGPNRLIPSEPAEFEIEIANTSDKPATNIIVQLNAPNGITISKLDRRSWLDEQNRTVTWKVAEIPSGFKTMIRYQAVSVTPGIHRQRITIGMDDVFQSELSLDTSVLMEPTEMNDQRPDF